ncbi:MAG TPA: outer membrane protein assembly factor BamD [Chitinophagaceae bacterium]|nr:outer membrane protein assembly factor BamD [Chitinophagaceae bacterium]HNF71250.1 outer membrane protein assembly factor BamD [Chitinophagaceae bacterium]
MKKPLLYLLLSLLVFSGCKDSFEKVQKSKDFPYKLTKADEYFNRRQWSKANTLYEELLSVYKGTRNFENIYYHYCMSFYNDGNYLAASFHFKNFTDLFPKSTRTDECEYLNCLCLYNLSPDYTLDQTNTVKAIGELQAYVNSHPESKKLDEANQLIDGLRAKLEQKDRYGADLYYKIGEYKAAAVAFEQIIRKYPDSGVGDYYQFMVLKSHYTYARYSIPEKQQERFTMVQEDFADFIQKFPKSSYRNEAERINTLSLASLKKLASK